MLRMQPWASLLVHGIKRIEGRSWRSGHRGRLWVHASGTAPDAAIIQACCWAALAAHSMQAVRTGSWQEQHCPDVLLRPSVCYSKLPAPPRLCQTCMLACSAALE